MYKPKVKHQRYINHSQSDGDNGYLDKLSAGMFHLPVMLQKHFSPPGRVAELT